MRPRPTRSPTWLRSAALVAALSVTGLVQASPDAALPRSAPPDTPAQGIANVPEAVLEAASEARGLPLAERIEAVSRPLLGRPYALDPLGEGGGIDPDPLARYDVFDCLTFVEEVLALAMAGDPAHAAALRNQLRYGDAPPRYENRRHFMELQWIPGNVASGLLRDTTKEYGETTRFEREVTPGLWRAWQRRSLFALTDDQLPLGTMALDVLSLDDAIAAADRIRPGSILLSVREDRSWIPLWTTHVSLVVPGDEPTLRHASRMKSAPEVVDHRMTWYLEHLKTYVNWPSAGIAILEPVEQGPRRALAPEAPGRVLRDGSPADARVSPAGSPGSRPRDGSPDRFRRDG